MAPHLLAVRQLPETVFQRAPRRAATGVIAIEAIHNFIGLPQQLLHMRRRGRRAQRGHRVFDAVLCQRYHVHVAFDHDHATCVADRTPRLIQAV